MNEREPIGLTGATGFIGSHVLEKLSGAGAEVIVLARPQSNVAHAQSLKAVIRRGDLGSLKELRQAFCGCRQVIHTAGLVGDWASRDDFYQANVVGTLKVLEACRLEGIGRVIITGSISSYGEENNPQSKNEDWAYHSHYPYFLDGVFPCRLNGYRDSKAAATEQAMGFAQQCQMDLTVLEPVWVYGEREFGTGFYDYVKAVQSGQRFMPGSCHNLLHVIYAKDLAKAFLLAAQKRLRGVERLIIGSARAEPLQRILGLFCQQAGLSTPRRLPKWCAYPLGFGLELAWTLARARRPPRLTRGRVNLFYDSIQYSTDKARRLLGFECEHSLEHGICQTVAWYKANHFL